MRLTELAHDYLAQQLKPGDRAIDATAGNGHDSAYMAQLVGPEGHVLAIDIQHAAINAAASFSLPTILHICHTVDQYTE